MAKKNMKVAVIGHSGMGGQAVVEQLLQRGHAVTGISIDADKVPAQSGLSNVQLDILHTSELTNVLQGHDVVVSVFSGGHAVDLSVYYLQIEGTRSMIKAVRDAEVPYFIYVGGAASLYVKPGLQMFDDPRFPTWYFGVQPPAHLRWLGEITGETFFFEAADRKENGSIAPGASDPFLEECIKDWRKVPLLEGCRIALELFEDKSSFQWSFLSPPWMYRPGPGTGQYELGVDFMIFKNGIPSGIDLPDLALAIVDETENQRLIHKHWTVSGEQNNYGV
ncbi:NAD dependent epimerase/dehydratase family protein [Vibrio aerogenes CECT 7868]|uniref:NAD dependent epimerase/dehydratase family protein n=1 Tax=Vibrio aerogenes CECT 7868 TaxID=1216006 RepID=A0A1M6EE68_9VIBR|nr:NAD(P)H-binding protein [Vibrio aerogenes]SHI83598.1 NAD dependent epimerase/dehydratase family protein [Vibrio aerogenes CECT 7868]